MADVLSIKWAWFLHFYGHYLSLLFLENYWNYFYVQINCRITKRGYPAETHTVQTEDGYILELHRIPYGLSGPSENRPPVLLQHGLESQSGDWIVNFGNQSLGYMLADVGYDVWLGNYRGNTYSRKHVSLDPDLDKEEFWSFSWQEHGNYDLAASIDYVLSETKFEQLTYFGHSMGTTGFFVLMANRTEYNAKIKTMVALAPVVSFSTISPNASIAIFAEHVDAFETILNTVGYYEILPHSDFFMFLASSICSAPDPVTCENVLYSIGGLVPNPDQLNSTRIPVYVSQDPAGQSTRDFFHYAQLIKNPPVFRAYDFGTIKNNQIYGEDPPPAYDLSLVTAPVALVWGDNDALALAGDVALLADALPNVVLNFRVDNELWNHLDFIWAIEAEQYQNKPIIDFLSSRK